MLGERWVRAVRWSVEKDRGTGFGEWRELHAGIWCRGVRRPVTSDCGVGLGTVWTSVVVEIPVVVRIRGPGTGRGPKVKTAVGGPHVVQADPVEADSLDTVPVYTSRAAVVLALARSLNLATYGNPDAADLAASYTYGFANNHGFVDGNKRTAWVVARLFLADNGQRLDFDPVDAIRVMEDVAGGRIGEADLAGWFRRYLKV